MAQARQFIFRLFYSTSFTLVFLLLIIVICVTPADAIYESYRRRRLLDIFLMTGDYVVTAFLAGLIYASRIYTNRSALKDIPKTFMPVEKEDLPGRRVHRLIQECLERSAVIAYQARPRSKNIEQDALIGGTKMLALANTRTSAEHPLEPRWGKIAHPGWSSPAAKELPNLEYATVVDELIDLVEAKAVSLAPVDLLAEPGPDGTPEPDPRVIEVLTRVESMGMRPYLQHLIAIGAAPDTSLTVAFLSAYERARFSSKPLSEEDFDAMMRMFAELLRNMTPVDVGMLDFDESTYASFSESASIIDHHDRLQIPEQEPETSSAASTFSNVDSVRRHKPPPRRISEDSAPSLSSVERKYDPDDATQENERSLRTAPTRATSSASRPRLRSGSRMNSATSRLSRSRASRRSTRSARSSGSGVSPRRMRQNRSVIHLARQDEGHGLPYTIQLPPE